MPPSALAFQGIGRRFGRLSVLRDVSAEVRAGQVLLVTGSNGSGKSTLLKCLAGLLAPNRGTITFTENGQALGTPDRRRRVGYLAPDLTFYEELSTLENLEFFARLRRVPTERGETLLARVGLPPDRASGALSSGMRQRLRWAWALLHRPTLLLLDEPFQNFDPPGEAMARQFLADHLADGGMAVIADPSGLELPHVATRLHLDG